MGRRPGAAAIPMLLLSLLASTTASLDVAHEAEKTRPVMLAEPLPDASLLQLPRSSTDDEPGREVAASSAVVDLLKSDAENAILRQVSSSKDTASLASTCSYTVTIKTSCYSPRVTHDVISLYFGDVYGNQVYAARLDDPYSGTFESCSTDTFLVTGPCGYKTCYLYMRRIGRDGWAPDWVRVLSPYTRQSVTFYYNGYALPANVWYGFNLCSFSSGGGGGNGKGGVAGWLWIGMLVLVVLVLQPLPFLTGLDLF